MEGDRNLITKQVHAYMMAGLAVATFVLNVIPFAFDFSYDNQLQISVIITFTLFVSIVGYFLDKKFPNRTEQIAGYEFLFYAVSIGLVIHFISYLNGPLIFIYGLIILSASYFLNTTNLNYLAGITSLFVVSEYLLLIRNGTVSFSLIEFTYVLLRILYLVLIARAGRNLSVSITTQKKQLVQILKLNKQLGELQRIKGDFLDIASHQLKTPLTVIRGNVSMMLDGDFGHVDKDIKRPLKEVENGTERLSDVINNVVDTLKFEGNLPVKINPDLVNYKQVLQGEAESFLADSWVKNVTIKVNAKEKIPSIYIDKEKIKIALSVLLGNAINHSPQNGQVEIRVSQEGSKLKTEIVDHGPAIIEKEIQKIFSRLKTRDTQQYHESMGLNLYVLKRIIESHEGSVFFETKKDSNIFGFYLPIKLIAKRNRAILKVPHV